MTSRGAMIMINRSYAVWWNRNPWAGYALSAALVFAATMLRWWLDPILETRSPFVIYYAAVMIAAWYGGWGPALLALLSGGFLASLLFIEPSDSILIYDLEHQVGAALYGAVGLVVIVLTESLRANHRRAELARADLAAGNVALEKEIAERKRAESWLLESEQRFRGYFEQGLVGMAMLSAERHWIEVNQRLCRLLGYSAEELMRKDWSELTHPDDIPLEDAQFQRVVDGVVKGYVMDRRFVCKDGRVLYTSLSAQYMRKDDGTLDCILVLIQDITDRKQLELDLRAAKDSADRAKTSAELANRAKDYFLAVLSHELRTPLNPVVMGVSMLQDKADLDPSVRETLDMVRRNAEMEARLIDDLLDLTRISRGKVVLHTQRVDLRTVVANAVEVCRSDIEAKGLAFTIDTGRDSPYWLDADAVRLQQVFWNLLKNAIKFTPQGGRVDVRCCLDGPAHVAVEVRDTGIGIDPESIPRLFNAFEQADRSDTRPYDGLGLGLAISKAMAEMHGGSIEAQSEGAGRGATFRVRLPLASPAAAPEPLAPTAPTQRVIGPLRILLVDDHGVTAKLMGRVLAADGHAVETAGDVATALRLADQHGFDLLISDVGLPDGSGHDLIRALRSRGIAYPAIALSGYGQEEDIQRSREAGFAAHLTKPVPRERLIQAIAAVASRQSTTSGPESADGESCSRGESNSCPRGGPGGNLRLDPSGEPDAGRRIG